MARLILCTQCDVGCFSEESAKKHEEKSGHKMDHGRDVTPLTEEDAKELLKGVDYENFE